jgi:hypothetical protein
LKVDFFGLGLAFRMLSAIFTLVMKFRLQDTRSAQRSHTGHLWLLATQTLSTDARSQGFLADYHHHLCLKAQDEGENLYYADISISQEITTSSKCDEGRRVPTNLAIYFQ